MHQLIIDDLYGFLPKEEASEQRAGAQHSANSEAHGDHHQGKGHRDKKLHCWVGMSHKEISHYSEMSRQKKVVQKVDVKSVTPHIAHPPCQTVVTRPKHLTLPKNGKDNDNAEKTIGEKLEDGVGTPSIERGIEHPHYEKDNDGNGHDPPFVCEGNKQLKMLPYYNSKTKEHIIHPVSHAKDIPFAPKKLHPVYPNQKNENYTSPNCHVFPSIQTE